MACSEWTVGALSEQWIEPLAEVLTSDRGVYVIVTDRTTRIIYANEATTHWINRNGDAGHSVLLSDALPPAVARERSAYIGDVLECDTTVTIDGIIDGEGLRCTMRRLPGAEAHRPAVLHVFMPISVVADEWTQPDDVVIARSNDLGILRNLSARELETLAMIALGLTSEQMAERIHRSRRTVDCHRAAISQKLRVRSSAQLTMLALRAGIIQMLRRSDARGQAELAPAVVDEFLDIAIATSTGTAISRSEDNGLLPDR